MGEIRFGPARVPRRSRPEEAVELLLERGYTRLRDRLRGQVLDGLRLGPRASASSPATPRSSSPCTRRSRASWATPSAARSSSMAVGMLDHSAGIAKAAGAEARRLPPRLPARAHARGGARLDVVEQLGELRARLEGKDRAVPFGVEVMGRVRELGTRGRRLRDLARGSAGSGPCSTSRTCTRPPTARSPTSSRSPRRSRGRRRRARARRAVPHPLQRHRSSRTATRRSTCPTARERCAPSRCGSARASSSGRRR